MSSLGQRAALLGTLVAVLGLLAFVTLRSNRPATITSALGRGLTPDAPAFVLPRLDRDGSLDFGHAARQRRRDQLLGVLVQAVQR